MISFPIQLPACFDNIFFLYFWIFLKKTLRRNFKKKHREFLCTEWPHFSVQFHVITLLHNLMVISASQPCFSLLLCNSTTSVDTSLIPMVFFLQLNTYCTKQSKSLHGLITQINFKMGITISICKDLKF